MRTIKACLFVENRFTKNQIFSQSLNAQVNFRFSKYILLKKIFHDNGIELCTQDINTEQDSKFTIYIDHLSEPKSAINYLIVNEPEIIIKKNHNINQLKKFKKVFTWNDLLVDGTHIIKYNNLNYDFNKIKFYQNTLEKKYLLICSNKKSNHKNENYSKRFEIVNFFEKNNFDFDFYGTGWKTKSYKNKYLNFLLNRLMNLNEKHFNNYGGEVENKILFGSKYIFQFAIENTISNDSYITEKIFDCFFSGCIPIYSGTSLIKNFIDKSTFIDLNNFKNLNDLLLHTENLDYSKIKGYHNSILNFFNSKQVKYFDFKYNTGILSKYILADIL